MKNFEIPKKPETMRGQIDVIWDVLTNHVLTVLKLHDFKMRFIIALLAINVALLGIILVKFII